MFAGCVMAVLAVTAGCGKPPQKGFDGRTLAVGQTFVERYDATADRPLSVYVPSGALVLSLQDQMSYLDDGSEYTFDDIEAADEAKPYVPLDLDLSVAGVSQSAARRLAVTLDGDKAVRTIDYGWGDILVFRARPNSHHKIRSNRRLAPSAGGADVDKKLDVQTWRLR